MVLNARVRGRSWPLWTGFPNGRALGDGGFGSLGSGAARRCGRQSTSLKRVEDWAVAALALVASAPLFVLIALAIKLESPGPVLFRQPRYGLNATPFEVFKFRTMHHDAADPQARRLTSRGDPRVTRVGAVLRRTSLDELPQLWNVLRGEMSVVGPRPHAVSAKVAGRLYRQAVPDYPKRYRVRPGMTGWAQVNGWRGPTNTLHELEMRVAHDLCYIDNWSIWFDLRIIVATLFNLVHRNAY